MPVAKHLMYNRLLSGISYANRASYTQTFALWGGGRDIPDLRYIEPACALYLWPIIGRSEPVDRASMGCPGGGEAKVIYHFGPMRNCI